MQRHPIDPISAALGVVAVVAGAVVATNSATSLEVHGLWLVITATTLLGLALLAVANRALAEEHTDGT